MITTSFPFLHLNQFRLIFFFNSKHALGVLLSDESSSEGGLGDQSEGDVQSVQVHSIPCHGKSGEVIN